MSPAPVGENAPPSEAEPEERRTGDAAVALPMLGLVLFTPPGIGVFTSEATILGAPAAVVAIFVLWTGLIVLAVFLSRALPARDVDDGA